MRLIVPMGGRGTRLRPLSNTTPKALLPLAGETVIGRIIRAVQAAVPRHLTDVVFVINPTDVRPEVSDQLASTCSGLNLPFSIMVQPEPLGTAHAVLCAGDYLEGEIMTVWSDTLFSTHAAADLDNSQAVAWTMEVDDPSRFGVAVKDQDGSVTRLIEKPRQPVSKETLTGVYYIRDGASLRRQIESMVAQHHTGAGGEYQLTDALDALVQSGTRMTTEPVKAWLDTGTLESYRHTLFSVLEENGNVDESALEDSRVIMPSFVAEGAVVRRSVIGPYVSIEEGAVVEDAVIRRSAVFRDAFVSRRILEGAIIGAGAICRGTSEQLVVGDDSRISGYLAG
jgi:glucose-1-phosphate thymidylyltransferase